VALRALAGVLLALLLLPPVALVLGTGPGAFVAGLRHPAVLPAARLSIETTAVALALTVALGTPLAWGLGRGPRRRWLEVLLELPLVLPPAVVGVALLTALGRRGLLGPALDALGVQIPFTAAAVVLAQVAVSAPLYVQSATTAFRGLDPELLAVARSLGASPARAFFRVALPLALPGLVGGAALAWARALGEFGATLLFAGNLPGRTQTLPLAIYTALESDVRAAQALSLVLLAVAAGLLLVLRGPVATRLAR
jgi:molybdate transport system permease protein